MTLQKIIICAAIVLGLAVPVFAFAQSAGATLTAAETKAKTRGDNEIDRRTAALTDLNTRVQAML